MSPLDPHDARRVLLALAGRIDSALDTRVRCLRAVPRIDGSLYFDLEIRAGGTERIDQLASAELRSLGPRGEALRERISAALSACLAQPEFALLSFCNRDRSRIAFDDTVVDVLLAGRFAPGRTRWFDYVFEGAFQEIPERFDLRFLGPSGEIVFCVHSAGSAVREGGQRVMANHVLMLEIAADPRPAGLRSSLAHQVERFLGFTLSRAVHPGLRLEAAAQRSSARVNREGEASAEPTMPDDGEPISTTRWGNPHQWFQFFSDFEQERSNLCAVEISDPVACVIHGEAECGCIEPFTFTPTVEWVQPPWPRRRGLSAPGSSTHLTALGETEAVLGGHEKLERALEEARSNRQARLVLLNDTCLPKIIGDDVDSALARHRRQSPVPIVRMNTDLSSPDSIFGDLLRQVLEQGRHIERSNGLGLVGFPAGRGREELIGLLTRLGVERCACLLPEFGQSCSKPFLGCTAGVVYPFGLYVDLAEHLLASGEGPALCVLPAPYGIRRSLEWLDAIRELLGLPVEPLGWLGPVLERWAQLSAQAAEHALAVVVDASQRERLYEPRRLYGFELLPLLEEMGFALRVLVRGPEDSCVLSRLAEPDRHECFFFQSTEELDGLMSRGDFDAVYSDLSFDSRLTRKGKPPFHLGFLELGPAGGLRGLERLLSLCRWPFFRRYSRHLGRAT
ncbi:MAG: hypothetical protein JXR96_29580 [Deltaproteobacteria bacterium]|nr:hypothetical protein [Deltaproteobacteria bacterium]